MKYVLMFAETEQFAADLAAMDDAERERTYARVGRWFAENTDQITRHVYLMPFETATTVRLDRGDPVIIDGPFVEGKEVVTGFAEIDVDNLDAALRLATTWPGCPIVEVRPIASP
jgi:hypothetical protein